MDISPDAPQQGGVPTSIPGDPTGLVPLVRAQAAAHPDRPALAGVGGTLTYRDLVARAERLAHSLRGLGVATDVRVALHAQRSQEAVLAVLAVLMAGGAYVPLDPTYPVERRALMLADSGARVLLTQRAFAGQLPCAGMVERLIDEELPAAAACSLADPRMVDLAYVIFTSGSTGRPKGIAMPHGPLTRLIHWQNHVSRLADGARTLQFSSLSFDVSFQELFATWTTGGCLVLIDESLRRDPAALLRFLAEQRVERLFLPFVALQQLAEGALRDPAMTWSLREVITAGEALRITPALRAWFARMPQCTLHNQYGPSETHVVTCHDLGGDPSRWPELPPIGRAVAGARIHLLTADRTPVHTGEPGELYIGGTALARGYLGRDDLTAERFIDAAPTGERERLYRTGDLGRLDADGAIEFLGRADDQVKIRGFRIEPGEIEVVLARHRAVGQAAVVARELVPGDLRLVGYVVLRPGAAATPAELRSWCASHLAEYQVPTVIMPMERLPLTPSGKVDRRALPAATLDRSQSGAAYQAPVDDIERRIADIWSSSLHQPRIGRDDNFFDLGGTSLLLTQVHERMQRDLGRELPITLIFEHPTIRALADHLVGRKAGDTAATAATRAAQQRNALLRQQQGRQQEQLRLRNDEIKQRDQGKGNG
jgi:amino acid adenylation domain-containing protein